MKSVQILIISFLGFLWGTCHHHNQLSSWEPEESPEVIGKKVALRFLESPHGSYGANQKAHIPYFEVCTWIGALWFAETSGDASLRNKLSQRFEPLFTSESGLLPDPTHVDFNVFGSLPLELYLQTHGEKYKTMGLVYADSQWSFPADSVVSDDAKQMMDEGYTWQTRMWIDDMYMITMVQAQAFRVTGDKNHIDRAAKEMVYYLEKLQQPNGLFYHAPDAPFFWGRGNGWMAAGMTELLRALPASHPNHVQILAGYKKMMKTLLTYQTASGAWRQLVDDTASWEESSCTGMFTYAMITGVKNGWLENEEYQEAARKGWLALIAFINADGDVTEVCEGTGKQNDHQYYLDRKRKVGDFHGQAPVLWCASALLRN